jgi:hypothetical protein
MSTIRSLFSSTRPIDRPIEKVIDYAAEDDERLGREIDEYEVTDNVESCFRKFLEHFGAGVRTGDVTEVGIWVSGFYGSGKSSFTKYLGFALDPNRKVGGSPFIDLLCDRLTTADVKSELRSLTKQQPTAVVMLDLGSQQLAATATAPVTTVLYWRLLQWAGYSKEKKLAELEFKLDEMARYDEFKQAYREQFPDKGKWVDVHNDPLIGVSRADQLVSDFLPGEFPNKGDFRSHKFELAEDVRDQTQRMIDLARRKSGHENIVFLIDEAGQYVAPRGELILNLDGLARNLKELGKGRVWIAATGQQTLAEIVERSAYNSAELNKLRDRFPISIELDARDIREITYRRLLTKSPDAEKDLAERFKKHGQAAVNFTRLSGTSLFKSDPDAGTFLKFYPFLPHHFDLLMELIRTLARSTGGIGLRSAIRVIQDLLVDASHSLPPGKKPIADRPTGTLACVDDFYDTLRADIGRVLPHVVSGVEKVEKIFASDLQTIRVAKAIAALQPIESFPRNSDNIAALLYSALDSPGQLDSVKASLQKLLTEKECSVVEDPQTGGFLFLSEGIKQYRDKRNGYVPSTSEVNQLRSRLLAKVFDPLPTTMLENVKKVQAGVRYSKVPVVGEGEDIQFRIDPVAPSSFDARRDELQVDTKSKREYENTIALLVSFPDELDEQLVEARRSDFIVSTIPEREADKDVAQFLRSEKRRGDNSEEAAQKLIEKSLLESGVFIFQGKPLPVSTAGKTLEAACRQIVGEAAKKVFPKFHLVPIRPNTDLAVKFLEVERLDRMPSEKDPLHLVGKSGGRFSVQVTCDALAEAQRAFKEMVDASGSGRIQGKAIQDHFAQPKYGWTKDATRYVFAALFRAGEIQLHSGEGTLSTVGPQALEAFKSTVQFNRAGVSIRDSRPPLDAMDRAATRLQDMFASEVLPLEDKISAAVRQHVPPLMEAVGPLPDRLRLLGLPGEDRARGLLETCADLMKNDAGNATMLLGANECAIPADVSWSKAISSCLDGGAETEIRQALNMLEDIDELGAMFPDAVDGLITDDDRATINESLKSENFYERMADVRGAVRSTLDHVCQQYSDCRGQYETELEEAKKQLEAMGEWVRISPDDQNEIGTRMTQVDVVDEPRESQELRDLRLLLARKSAVAGRLATLQDEVRNRVPALVLEEEEQTETGEKVFTETILVAELVPSDVLKDRDELESWLKSLRERLGTLIDEHKHIRITQK